MSRSDAPLLVRLARRVLDRTLPDDGWSRELLAELDREYAVRARDDGRGRAARWYVRQVASPQVWRFVWLVRRRRRAGGEMMFEDVRHALRGLRREWRTTGFIVLTLGLGIAANAAMYGVAERLFLAGPEHVEEPERVARVFLRVGGGTDSERTTPYIPWNVAEAIRNEGRVLDAAAYRIEETVVDLGPASRPVAVTWAQPAYFDVLGVVPRVGRFLGPVDGDGAVVSHRLWRSVFGGGSDALGRSVQVGGRSYTIRGVAPDGFVGPGLSPVDLWVPLDPESAGSRNWHVLGRLPGAGDPAALRDRAAADAQVIHERTDPGRFFGWARGAEVLALPLGYDDSGRPPPEAAVARLLAAVAVLILVVGMANVVSLLLARLTRRRREVAVRLALGAGRARLARLLFSETLALAVLAGLASLPLAWVAGTVLRRVLLPDVAWSGPPVGPSALVLTGAVTLVVGALVGLLPLRHAGRTSVVDDLRAGRPGGGAPATRVHLGLMAAQVALSAALLLGAGLFLKSFVNLRVTDLGVDADEVVAFRLRALDPADIPSPDPAELALYRRALDLARTDPDVVDATVSLGLPFLINFGLSVSVPGRDSVPQLPGGGPFLTAVDEDYFDVLGTPIVAGRTFTAEELAADALVVVVSEAMAATLWPGADPLGSCLRIGSDASPCSTVVGVAGDVHRVGYREPPSMQFYVPLAPGGSFGGLSLVVRPRRADAATIERIRARLTSVDPVVAWADATRLDQALAEQIRPWYLGASVLGMASLVALLVSLVGVYGVLAYLVEQRRREMGVRIALGASTAGIRGLVVRRGLGAAALGLAAGAAAVVLGRPWLEPLLFETSATDPLVLAAVSVTLLGTAALACLVPSNRAARVPPAMCLREE